MKIRVSSSGNLIEVDNVDGMKVIDGSLVLIRKGTDVPYNYHGIKGAIAIFREWKQAYPIDGCENGINNN